MAENLGSTRPGIDQVSTLDVAPSPVPPLDAQAAPSVRPGQPGGNAGSPFAGKDPQNGTQANNPSQQQGSPTDPTLGVGTEGELEVWEGRYSVRNFLGPMLFWSILSIGWLAMSLAAWGYDYNGLQVPAVIAAVIIGLAWVNLLFRITRARLGHRYRLTTRRLFVTTGIFHRETDQLELLRVQDVFHSQGGVLHRMFNLGTVTIVSDQKTMPNYQLLGVSDPKAVMDLIWHHARAEQDQRNVRVEQI